MPARPKEVRLGGRRRYRKLGAQHKLEIVLVGLRRDRSVRDVCREHGILGRLYYE